MQSFFSTSLLKQIFLKRQEFVKKMASRLKLPGERKFEGPAPVWKRLAAFVIDLLILDFVVVLPFRGVFRKLVPAESINSVYAYLASQPDINAWLTYVSLITGIFFIAYFVILESRLNQSIGKIVMNIYVKSTDKKITFGQHLLRSLYLLPVFPFVLLWILDPLFMFFTSSNQRLSEILSKTKTVQQYTLV